jgi:hypothetical protein
MTTETPPASPSQRSRVLGMTGQTAGAVGIVVSLVLVVVVILGRGWAVDRVDEVALKIDDGLAKGVPLLDTASEKVSTVAGRVGVVVDALEAEAADPGPVPALLQNLVAKANDVSDKYLELRATYTDARTKLAGVLDTLQTLDRLVPGIDLPAGPVDALTALDERIQALDGSVMSVIGALPDVGDGQAIAALAEQAAKLETALTTVTAGLDEAQAKLDNLRAEVAATADTVNTVITIAAIVLVLAFLYSALLHWVLYRSSRDMRRGGDGA